MERGWGDVLGEDNSKPSRREIIREAGWQIVYVWLQKGGESGVPSKIRTVKYRTGKGRESEHCILMKMKTNRSFKVI